MTTTEAKSANELAQERTDLAGRRTVMAADRSLMAWIRTALSMISFGFTIYKLLEGLKQSGATLANPNMPRNLGLFLIALGTASMFLGALEYRTTLRALGRTMVVRLWRPSFVIAVVMAITGLFLFVSIITRVL